MREGQNQQFTRTLRKNATDAERVLWRHLRNRQLHGLRFRRQLPIGPYIADFACLDARVVIELDGGQHNGKPSDRDRDDYLRAAGFRVVRFWNPDVVQDLDAVARVILAACSPRACGPLPNPPPQAGEGAK